MTPTLNSIPRPDLALGRYPERNTLVHDQLDETFSRVASRLATRWGFRTERLKRVANKINHTGRSLSTLSDEELLTAIRQLRPHLVRAAWTEEHAVRAFAVVREMSDRTIGMRHFESQLLGGWVMFHGKLAEMHTGEGKTLTATLPAATAAMAGVPVHVITTNDYLAVRAAANMRPLYEALGLTVGVVTDKMDIEARRAAYACDITYCSNKQVAFDYLRDRVARGTAFNKLRLDLEHINDTPSPCNSLMLRGLCFAIVDEADSVLIDEARTPLVLSHTVDGEDPMQAMYQQAVFLAKGLTVGDDFRLHDTGRQVELTACGCDRLGELAGQMGSIWSAARQREELVLQALSALHTYIRDRDYVVREQKVQIVDRHTGRALADRSWERGLHQMIECKEHCEPSGRKQTLARMSYQRFYRRYLKLAGMTGTAMEVETEFGAVYGLSVVRIPPHSTPRRIALPEQVFIRDKDANATVVERACEQAAQGRPVLIGTRSVLKSEYFAQLLEQAGFKAQVLNARQDADEANIIALAGKSGQITVATNITDILLGPGVKHRGGLHIIVTERNDSARVDRQLVGRCGRQGDPGSYQFISSLETDVPRHYCSSSIFGWLTASDCDLPRQLPGWFGSLLLLLAQRRLERQHELVRRQVDRESELINGVLSFTGPSA